MEALTQMIRIQILVDVVNTASYVKDIYAKSVMKDFILVQVSAYHVQGAAKNAWEFGTVKNANQSFN